MKKIFLLIAAMGLLMSAISCSNDDEPSKRGDGVFTVNTPMINHIVDLNNGNVLGMSATHNKITIDTTKHQASVELTYNAGNGDKKVSISGLTATPVRLGFYELKAPQGSQLKDFSGYVDFNESSIRYAYTTNEGFRVISTIQDVFFLKTHNTITYLDTTKTTSMENVMYQFTLSPTKTTAIVKVMALLHAKHMKFFNNITATTVPVTVTPNGYTFTGENIPTTAVYRNWTDSVGVPTLKSTDQYPFKTFNTVVDLENDTIIANFMMGDSAIVSANGRTYPNYTRY
jgi:hypothetical protein